MKRKINVVGRLRISLHGKYIRMVDRIMIDSGLSSRTETVRQCILLARYLCEMTEKGYMLQLCRGEEKRNMVLIPLIISKFFEVKKHK
jgi:metal-responsive CopG/Arc/MetJ family transcriptional regulator